MKPSPSPKPNNPWPLALALMAGLLCLLFCRSFLPGYVHFSNDWPLGAQIADWYKMPGALTGMWSDQCGVGGNCGSWTLMPMALMHWWLSPLVFAKFFPVICLFIVGLGAWTFFRCLKFSPLASLLGALATMLNSTVFTNACWGVAPQETSLGLAFFAMALVVANTPETPSLTRWLRLALAGCCVGINVMESADIGALFSLLVAAFVFYKALTEENRGGFKKAAAGVLRVAVVAGFAGFISFQSVSGLIGTQIQGVAGIAQDKETKAVHWDFATQWSMPKKETLGLVVPGLFGYRMDTPKDMMPQFQDCYRGGNYWGGVGRDPNIDRYFDQGGETSSGGLMRFIGAGSYCGILVVLVAIWASAQSFRRQNSPYNNAQKKWIWFWLAVLVLSLPVSWGRFAPLSQTSDSPLFYALLYKLPYFSTIRNPIKFLYFFSWALVVLFAYGIQALGKNLNPALPKSAGISSQLKRWWSRAGQFDRRWTFACAGMFIVVLLGWAVFVLKRPAFIQYLKKVGFGDDAMASEIATFSIRQAGWFLPLFGVAIVLLILVLSGYFAGSRSRLGAFLLGAFLVFDLVRADLPYIIHWDYKQKYEVGTPNPILQFLAKNPYEQRVGKLLPRPLTTPSQFEPFDQLYEIEWKQHQFLFYKILMSDIIQMPREPADWHAFQTAVGIGIKQDASGQWVLDQSTFPLLARKWELTSTRYLLGPAQFVGLFNEQFDPGKGRFHILQRFSIGLKPGVGEFHQRLEELTTFPNENGDYALIEFTGALPRAKLYSNWETISPAELKNFSTNGFTAKELDIFNNAGTNGFITLQKLASLAFDPARTLLIDTPPKDLPATATNENSGTVEFKSYSSKHIVFSAVAKSPSILLFNDKYDPGWHVTVDGQPAELLRCNYLMRGVYLKPGEHTVVFHFSLPNKPLYITLSGMGVGLVLGVALVVVTRRKKQ